MIVKKTIIFVFETVSLIGMKLIAESGSTKTEWSLVEGEHLIQRVFTEGLNPFFQTRREISRSIRLGLPDSFFKRKLEQVFFYGAGCTSAEKKSVVEASLVAQFKTPAYVESDLLAAARGLFQHDSGIACILGTGSNSCFYDGHVIVKNVRAGGYILGDEGSGAALGKQFLSDVLKKLAPQVLIDDFFEKYDLTPHDVMDAVYNRPFPNRFLAEQSCFLADYLRLDYVKGLLLSNLRSFFLRNVMQYDYLNYPIRFVGSVAYNYADLLHQVGKEFGVELSVVEETPMGGLIKYHAFPSDDAGN